ncbi:MAG: hypothetical protein U9P14_07440, partial [Gemmatimonadota bacterium]|nr:hypothetical protein [Gemmatimonadota bacterium]
YTWYAGRIVSSFWLLRTMNLVFILTSFVLFITIWYKYHNRGERPQPVVRTGKIFSYGLYCLAAALTVIFIAGAWGAGRWKGLKGRDSFITGYNGPVDTTMTIPGKGGKIDQGIPAPGFTFNRLGLWIERDSANICQDTVVASLRWHSRSGVPEERTDRVPVSGLEAKAFHLFEFGDICLPENTPLILELERNSADPCCGLRAGLITRGDRPRVIDSGLSNLRRTREGKVELVACNTEYLDFRLASSAIDPEYQLALSYFRHLPEDEAEAVRWIAGRVTADRGFFIFYLCLIGAILAGLTVLVFRGCGPGPE